jgi:uncharacterized protein YcfJ
MKLKLNKQSGMKGILFAVSIITLPGCVTSVDTDLFAPARILTQTKECGMVQVPVYGVLDRPASKTEIAAGTVVGGALGNQIGKGNGKKAMTVLGAIIGGSKGAQRKQERVITGYKEEHQCKTVYK